MFWAVHATAVVARQARAAAAPVATRQPPNGDDCHDKVHPLGHRPSCAAGAGPGQPLSRVHHQRPGHLAAIPQATRKPVSPVTRESPTGLPGIFSAGLQADSAGRDMLVEQVQQDRGHARLPSCDVRGLDDSFGGQNDAPGHVLDARQQLL